MTILRLFTLSLISLFSASAFAQSQVRNFAPVNHLFVPSGFDNNDHSEVVVTGYLPSPCHERPTSQVRVSGSTVQIQVVTGQKPGSEENRAFCPDVVVPFTEVVNVGYLPSGRYKILVNEKSDSKQVGSIQVVPSTISTIDEHPYALIQQVEQDSRDMKYYLVGSIYSDCFVLDSLKYSSNGKDAISVLPILKQVSSHCATKITPFRVRMNPPMSTLSSPYFLFHVRSADGKSVNYVGSKK